jgi:hypothetical protein
VHCFVLLGVSFNQLKLNRVRAKQCYLISEFRLRTDNSKLTAENLILAAGLRRQGVHSQSWFLFHSKLDSVN